MRKCWLTYLFSEAVLEEEPLIINLQLYSNRTPSLRAVGPGRWTVVGGWIDRDGWWMWFIAAAAEGHKWVCVSALAVVERLPVAGLLSFHKSQHWSENKHPREDKTRWVEGCWDRVKGPSFPKAKESLHDHYSDAPASWRVLEAMDAQTQEEMCFVF